MALLVIQLNCLFSSKFKCKTLCRKARLLLSNFIFPFVVIFSVTVSQVVSVVLRTVRKWRFTCTSNKRTHASVKAGTKTDVEMQLKVEFCLWVMFLAHLNNSPKRYIYSFVSQSVSPWIHHLERPEIFMHIQTPPTPGQRMVDRTKLKKKGKHLFFYLSEMSNLFFLWVGPSCREPLSD